MKITTIISTYNRADSLNDTLKSYSQQSLNSELHELIVIDNNSTDNTSEVIQQWQAKVPFNIINLFEARQGTHYARNRAIKEAKGDILFFTDDDVDLAPNLLQNFYDCFSQTDTLVATGPIRPQWESEPPQWLLDRLNNDNNCAQLSVINFDEQTVPEQFYIYSCHLAIRKETVVAAGGFHPDFAGTIWVGDGESGINEYLAATQTKIQYLPDATVFHRIPASRITRDYFIQWMRNQGIASAYNHYRKNKWAPQEISRIIRDSHIKLTQRWRDSFMEAKKGNSEAGFEHKMQYAFLSAYSDYLSRLLWDQDFKAFVKFDNWLADDVPAPPQMENFIELAPIHPPSDKTFAIENRQAYIQQVIHLIGNSSYALFGAGQHSQWWLDLCREKNLKLPTFIIDDFSDAKELDSLPIKRSPQSEQQCPDFVILSSDCPSVQSKMKNSSQKLQNWCSVIDLYKDFLPGPYC